MVFRGKPSKGCGHCRSRKIRCDQERPACLQCVKTNRECPGYRDELSLIFRDESQQVVRKSKDGASTRTAQSRATGRTSRRSNPQLPQSGTEALVQGGIVDFNDPHQDLMHQIVKGPIGIQPSFAPTEFEASCFFVRYNTWPGAFWTNTDNIPDFFSSGGSVSQRAIKACIISAGAAMLSRITKFQPLKLAAARQYGSALTLMNATLSDNVEARTNSTLAAVILLAIFEVITSRAPRNIENWTNHINGAASLLELRGVEQLQTEEGLGLFLQLRFQIIISCLQRATYVPESVVECTRLAMFLRPQTQAHGDSLIRICARLANLYADIDTKALSDSAELLSAAYAIEGELVAWLAALPSDFSYSTVEIGMLEPLFKDRRCRVLPYNNKYHVYRSFWLCNAWNQYRSARIMANHIILCYLKRISANNPANSLSGNIQGQLHVICNTMDQLSEDFCASVPYNLGAGEMEHTPGWSPNSDSFIGGYVLLWPLFLVGTTKRRTHPMRVWVMDCLKHVGHAMGIDQALALVDIMESGGGRFSPDEI